MLQESQLNARKSILDRYQDGLQQIPSPGTGCHTALLRPANYGIIAGLDPAEIIRDIQESIPTGNRTVPVREIEDAVRRAQMDCKPFDSSRPYLPPTPKQKAPQIDGQAALARIIARGSAVTEADLWHTSPIRLDCELRDDAVLFLKTMFRLDDLLFIGERDQPGILGKTIRTAEDWIAFFQGGGEIPSLILCNPLSGQPGERKGDGGSTLRGDACVSRFDHCIIEFDGISRADQVHFFAGLPLPIKALVDSGNRSIHGWLDLRGWKITDLETWEKIIKQRLFRKTLGPMGADVACANASRLSRMPGSVRSQTARYQQLMWLSEKGQAWKRTQATETLKI